MTTLLTFEPTTINNAVPAIGYLSAGIGGLWVGKRAGENGGETTSGRRGLPGIVLLVSAAWLGAYEFRIHLCTRISTLIVSTLGGLSASTYSVEGTNCFSRRFDNVCLGSRRMLVAYFLDTILSWLRRNPSADGERLN